MPIIVREAVLLVAVGLALGLAANGLREDGLALTRDHFPAGPLVGAAGASAPGVSPAGSPSLRDQRPQLGDPGEQSAAQPDVEAEPLASAPAADAHTDEPGGPTTDASLDPHVVERLAAKGLTPVTHAEAEALWRDPMHQQYGATLFIDARRAEQYAENHIPGAYHFDPFYPERHIDALLPLLSSAQTVVVYCAGGACDDSESAALFLQQFGVPSASLRVYVGGMGSWTAAALPLESGERGSAAALDGDG